MDLQIKLERSLVSDAHDVIIFAWFGTLQLALEAGSASFGWLRRRCFGSFGCLNAQFGPLEFSGPGHFVDLCSNNGVLRMSFAES